MELLFTRKRGITHNFHDNVSFIKPIRSIIEHVDVRNPLKRINIPFTFGGNFFFYFGDVSDKIRPGFKTFAGLFNVTKLRKRHVLGRSGFQNMTFRNLP